MTIGPLALNTLAIGQTGDLNLATPQAALTRVINTLPVNGFTVEYVIAPTGRGRFKIVETFVPEARSKHNVVVKRWSQSGSGDFTQEQIFSGMVGKGASSTIGLRVRMEATSSFFLWNAFDQDGRGKSKSKESFAPEGRSKFGFFLTYTVSSSGVHAQGLRFTGEGKGTHAFLGELFTRSIRQAFRVEDDSLERWEIYVGEDELPDFDAAPAATGTSLPINWDIPVPAPGETVVLNVVTRKRNKFGLLSLNQDPTLIEVDEDVLTTLGPLSTPTLSRVIDIEDGVVRVQASYPNGVDLNEADQWEVFAVEPPTGIVLGTTVPVLTSTFTAPVGAHLLNANITGLTAGVEYDFAVAVKRSSDSAAVLSNTKNFTLAETFDLDSDQLSAFGGDQYEEKG